MLKLITMMASMVFKKCFFVFIIFSWNVISLKMSIKSCFMKKIYWKIAIGNRIVLTKKRPLNKVFQRNPDHSGLGSYLLEEWRHLSDSNRWTKVLQTRLLDHSSKVPWCGLQVADYGFSVVNQHILHIRLGTMEEWVVTTEKQIDDFWGRNLFCSDPHRS